MQNNDLKKVLYTDFVSTETLIENLLGEKEFKRAVTRSNLYKFWAKVVGEKFANRSKPYSIIGSTIIVACENAVVAQELTLRKTQLLVKFEPYLKSLKLKANDIKFDQKKWMS